MPGSPDDDPRREKVRDHVDFVPDDDEVSVASRDGTPTAGSSGRRETGRSGRQEPGSTPGDHDAPDRSTSPSDGEPDEVEDLLEELDVDGDLEDDELDTDERVERFGNYAGLLVLPTLALALFVGPWRLFDFTLAAAPVPFTVRESATGLVLLAPLPIILLVGVGAGAIYRATTDDRPDDYRAGIATQIIVVEVLAIAVGYLLVLLLLGGAMVLDGEVIGALILVVAGLIGLVFFSFFEFVAVAIAVGVPAYVGVFFGDMMGVLARKMDT